MPEIIKAWADYTNKHGGVGGRSVEVVDYDTKGDVPTAVADAHKMVNDPTIVAAAIGDVSTELEAMPILSKAKLPVVGGLGYTPQVWGGPSGMGLPYVYGTTVTNPDNIIAAAVTAKQEDANVWMAALCTESPSCASATAYFGPALKAAGITNAGTLGTAAAAPNYDAQCLQAIQKNVDVISLQLQGPTAVRVAADCVAQGYKGQFEVNHTTVTPDVYQKINNLYGAINGFPWYVNAQPVVQYRTEMESEGISADDWGNPSSTATYAGMELFKKVMAAAAQGSAPITRSVVIDQYSKVKNETLGGLLPQPMTFSNGGPPQPVKCFWAYVKKDGKLTGSFTPTCDS